MFHQEVKKQYVNFTEVNKMGLGKNNDKDKGGDGGGGMTFRDRMNQNNKDELRGILPNVTPDEYYIHPNLKEDLELAIATLKGIEKFGKKMGHRNYILKGPPGVGKTLGVKYIATQLGAKFYDGRMANTPQGITAMFKNLRDLVKEENDIFRLIMINELDKFSSRDDIIDPTQQQTLNTLLDELDGAESNHGLFFFGTTNKPDSLDSALRRPGRFSKEIEFMPPDYQGRLEILKIHALNKNEESDFNHDFIVDERLLDAAARVTFGYTGADLVGLLNEAFGYANFKERLEITKEDLEFAKKKTKPSALRDMPFIEPTLKFKDVGGYEGHKEVMRKIIENSDESIVMFYGPPGVGKTTFAEAVAGEYGYNMISVSGSSPEDKFVGETNKIIERYLDRAKQVAPCILLFDQIDALVQTEGTKSWKDSWTGSLESRLSKPIDGVYIIATLNNPEETKRSFLDRFLHKLYFDMPTHDEQEAIWNLYLPEGIGINPLLREPGFISGRDIAKAHQMVIDYGMEEIGVEATIDLYNELIGVPELNKEEPAWAIKYKEIVGRVGDSVADYQKIKEFKKGLGEKVLPLEDKRSEAAKKPEAAKSAGGWGG